MNRKDGENRPSASKDENVTTQDSVKKANENEVRPEIHSNMNFDHNLLHRVKVEKVNTVHENQTKKFLSVKEVQIKQEQSSDALKNKSALNFPSFICSICDERKALTECLLVKSCPHMLCMSCTENFISAKLDENVRDIRCPVMECKDGVLDLQMCRGTISDKLFDKWGLALCVASLGVNKICCPFTDCSALLFIDIHNSNQGNGVVVSNAECPHCHRMFCANCKVSWHADIDCQTFQMKRNSSNVSTI